MTHMNFNGPNMLLPDGEGWHGMGLALRATREDSQWTQRDLMDYLGYGSTTSIDTLETKGGMSRLSLQRFLLIQDKFGHELDAFLNLESEVWRNTDVHHRLLRAWAFLSDDAQVMLLSHAEALAAPAVAEELEERQKLIVASARQGVVG